MIAFAQALLGLDHHAAKLREHLELLDRRIGGPQGEDVGRTNPGPVRVGTAADLDGPLKICRSEVALNRARGRRGEGRRESHKYSRLSPTARRNGRIAHPPLILQEQLMVHRVRPSLRSLAGLGLVITAAAVALPAVSVRVSAQAARTATTSAASLPPIIDRELIFGDPEIAGSQLSPDGQFLSFLKPFKGTRNIWVKRTDEPFDKAKPITADTKRPISAYFWSRDSKYVLYAQDQLGDENFNVYAVKPSDQPGAGSDVPAARNITEAKGVQTRIYAVPKSDPDLIYVGLNDRDKAWHDLYKVRISTGERTLLRKNTERISNWTFDLAGKLRLATRSPENGDTEVLRVDDTGFSKIYTCNVFESCGPVRFHKDGRRVYFETNKD